ncbi:MAG TPA: hypothetical protein VF796_23515 [Humisphaera sp.]
MTSMFVVVVSVALLFVGILAAIEIGFRAGLRGRRRDPDSVTRGIGGMEGAVFGLLGLLLAFLFGGAASRFEHRRGLIVDEANAIGTAYLRMDLLPEPERAENRKLFAAYVDTRIDRHARGPDGQDDPDAARREADLQARIWATSLAALKQVDSNAATTLVVSALNAAFDAAATRAAASRVHAPPAVTTLMFAIVGLGATLAGFSMAARLKRARLHSLVFALALTATVYVTLDLDLPRAGLIRIDDSDRPMVEVRKSM